MFFLSISANIFIYLLASAFLGVILYTQEKSVPAEYFTSCIAVVETPQEDLIHCEWWYYYEQPVSKAEKEPETVYIEMRIPVYVPPLYRSSFLIRSDLRAPPLRLA